MRQLLLLIWLDSIRDCNKFTEMLEIGLGSQRNRSSLTVKRLEKTKFTLDQEGVLGRANTHTEIAVGSYSKSGDDNVFPHRLEADLTV